MKLTSILVQVRIYYGRISNSAYIPLFNALTDSVISLLDNGMGEAGSNMNDLLQNQDTTALEEGEHNGDGDEEVEDDEDEQ